MIFKNDDERDLAIMWGVEDFPGTFDDYCQVIYKPISENEILDTKNYLNTTWRQCNNITAIMKKYQWREFYKNEIALWNENPIMKSGNHFYTDFMVNRFNNAHTPKTKEERQDPLTTLNLKNYLTGVGAIARMSPYYSTFKNELMVKFIENYNIKSIIDPCSGWGERLITCGLAGINYTGIDVNPALQSGYNQIISDFNFRNIKMCEADSSIFCVSGEYDCVFTCPPYWDRELYTKKGAENLNLKDFTVWWNELVQNYAPHITIFAYQIDDLHATIMNEVIIKNGFKLINIISSTTQTSDHMVKASTSLEHHKRDNQERVYVFTKIK